MSIVVGKVKAAFGGPVVVLGLMRAALVALQCCLPLATAVKIGADEAAFFPVVSIKLPPAPCGWLHQ